MNLKYTNNIPNARELCDLFVSIGWSGTHTNEDKIKKSLAFNNVFVVSVYDNDQLVGFGKVLEDGLRCLLYDLAVNPAYERQGIGKNIMNNLISYAKQKGYGEVRLFYWKENPMLVPFYESIGFKNMDNAMKKII